MTQPSMISVLFLVSEADPLIKVGGLGDVGGSLPQALKALNVSQESESIEIDIRLVLPFHPALKVDQYHPSRVTSYNIRTSSGNLLVDVDELNLDGLPVYLINGAPIEQSPGVYSSNLEADGYKYVFFSQAALHLPQKIGWKADILHANDWHTAPAVYSLALNRPLDPFLKQMVSMLTIHNLPYLGSMTSPALTAFELPPAENTSLPAWANHMALPLGLLTADSIVAVSPGYAKEILTNEFGSGLQTFLRAQAPKIRGILNGLDTKRWNPADDVSLAATFSMDNLDTRSLNKAALQDEIGLEKNPCIPILAMVTRMDPQKGVDLAVDALRMLFQKTDDPVQPFQAIFLGSGNPTLEQAATRLEQDYPQQVRIHIGYNEPLSRHIYSGADILLMPSRYEPCGLSQMIAMRYGCVPVARATGGLIDTVQDTETSARGTGFLFKQATSQALAGAIQRALNAYHQTPDLWREMQLNGMQQDFSWSRSARDYLALYKKLMKDQRQPGKYV